jgi:NADH:ubiquinone oxidoreductase subunit 6 (subunit J)
VALNFLKYSISLLFLFSVPVFIIFSDKIINVFISLVFFSSLISFLLYNLKYEYFAFIYFIIYFGAVLILFLFIIMLLDIENITSIPNIYINKNIIFILCVQIKIFF